jgi:hypothetical protein
MLRNNAVRYGTAWLVVVSAVGLIDYARLQGGSSHPQASSPARAAPLPIPPAHSSVTPGPAAFGAPRTPSANRSQARRSSPRLVSAKAAVRSAGSAQVGAPSQPVELLNTAVPRPVQPPATPRPYVSAEPRVVSRPRYAVPAPTWRRTYSPPDTYRDSRYADPWQRDTAPTQPTDPGLRTQVTVGPAIDTSDQMGIPSQSGGSR